MPTNPIASTVARTASTLLVMTMAACGGGGSGGGFPIATTSNSTASNQPSSAPATQTQAVSTKVIDGAIANAFVFLDKNGNGAYDEGEPNGRTDAQGAVTLQVAPEDVGTAPILALVGTDAVDADTGPVPTAFVLSAPADSTGVISPLTTLVQRVVADSGVTTAQANATLQGQSGVAASFLTDYTIDTTSAGKTASLAARLLTLSTQQEMSSLASVVGTADASGSTITAADLATAIQRALLNSLGSVGPSLQDTSVINSCSAGVASNDCETAIASQSSLLAISSGLTAITAPIVIGAARTPDAAPATPVTPMASASVVFMNFGDAGNWYYKAYVSTVAESTPDAAGLVHYRGMQVNDVAGTLYTWGSSYSYARRNDTHWNGSAWVLCLASTVSAQTTRDANGRVQNNNYCDGVSINSSQRSVLDISGKAMTDVVATIKASTPSYATWGDPATSYTGGGRANYGGTVFPANSKLYYQTNVTTSNALAYDPTASAKHYSLGIAAGGDYASGAAPACGLQEVYNGATIPSTTLDELISTARGTPCVYASSSVTGAGGVIYTGANDWWDQSTLNLGTIGTAAVVATPTSYATGNVVLRIGFPTGGGQVVNYYSCSQRQVLGSSVACKLLGAGTYTIETLGDARAMTLQNPPAEAVGLSYERIFVERAGAVYYGYRSKPSVQTTTRLNLDAANALFTQIGIPAIAP